MNDQSKRDGSTGLGRIVVVALALLACLLVPSVCAQKDKPPTAVKPAAAADENKADAEQSAAVVALRGGKVITITGRTIRRGTVLIKGGKIEAVGDEVEVPAGAEIVDCTGKVVMPGFVPALAWGAGLATLGRGFVDDGRDLDYNDGHDAAAEPETTPADARALATAGAIRLATSCDPFFRTVRASDLLNPDTAAADVVKDSLDPFGRSLVLLNAAGITSSWIPGRGSLPAMAMLFGMSSPPSAGTGGVVVKYDRDRLDGMFVSSGRFLVMDLRNVAGVKKRTLFDELDDTARYRRELAAHAKVKAEYDAAKKKYRDDKKAGKKVGEEPKAPKAPKKPAAATKWEPLLDGKRVLRVWAETAAQIRLALRLAERHGIQLVIDDAVEGWAIAAEIARVGAMVVVNPRRVVEVTEMPATNPGRIYHHGSSIENAAILARHGVKVAVVPPAPALIAMGVGGRDLLTISLDAAFAMRGGLSRADALKSITLHPAQMLGIADRAGSIEPGKDADVLVLDGDPLDHKTFVERTYVSGRLVYEKDKEPLFDHVKRGRLAKPVWNWPPAGQ